MPRRTPTHSHRSRTVAARVTPREGRLLDALARGAGYSPSSYLRLLVLHAIEAGVSPGHWRDEPASLPSPEAALTNAHA